VEQRGPRDTILFSMFDIRILFRRSAQILHKIKFADRHKFRFDDP
jgi:hypothetical protein